MALIISAACPVFAQGTRRIIEEPRWLKYQLREVSSGIYAEAIYDETTFPGTSTTVSHEREFVGPLLGASAIGSIYHPNLIRFQTDLDGALGYSLDSVKGAGPGATREEFQFLGRFNGTANILANRPYNGSVFGSYDHSYRDYDFFNRVTVDSSQYGARANYSGTNYFVTAYYTHRDETADGLRTRTVTSDDILGLNGRYDRATGSSALNYTYNSYDRAEAGGGVGIGSDHTVTLSDSENFGTTHRAALNSSLTYSHRDTGEELIDQATANTVLSIEHPRNLWSYYDATYDRYQNDDFTSDAVIGTAQVRHQLFSSLASSLTLNGSDFEVSDDISEGYTRRIGVAWGEAYTKKVGRTGRLNVGNTLAADHVDQSTISTIENERHRFDENAGSFFLNLTDIDPLSIVITDINDARPAFAEGIDYIVTQVGGRTLITQTAGSRIGLSQTVLIDYRVERLTSGEYESLTETFTVRFDVLNNFWGVYGRLNLWHNNAPDELRVPNLISYAVGTDLSWRWFRTGVEYEVYDSDLAQYRAARAYQSATFRIDDASALSVNFSEARVDYDDSGRQENQFRFITRYYQAFTHRLRFDIEGGIDMRRGDIIDQTLAAVRPGIQYSYGKTSIRAGYDFEYNLTETEERYRHRFVFRCRRVF